MTSPGTAPRATPGDLGLHAALHPGAWWLWALGLAAAAGRTTNPLLLGLLVAVAGYVVAVRRTHAPWSGAFNVFLRLALLVVALRTAFHILLGGVEGPTTLVHLPEVRLPEWAQAIRLGGPVSAEGLTSTLYEGLRLGTVLVCVGAANALANPKRMLRCLPGALYEVSVAVVVAMSTAPQLVSSAGRIRRARALRGNPRRGVRGLRDVLAPVLTDALDRSLELAASMDARGYGRTAQVPVAQRRGTAVLLLGGLLGVCVGLFVLLGSLGGASGTAGPVLLAVGLLAAAAGLVLGGRRVPRSRYRPDPWRAREWAVVAAGAAPLLGILAAEALAPGALVPPTFPVGVPSLPWPAALGALAALAPALVAPPPARTALRAEPALT